jgi:hypothetical protein
VLFAAAELVGWTGADGAIHRLGATTADYDPRYEEILRLVGGGQQTRLTRALLGFVGWVERSDTHHLLFVKMMGFAKGSTHPTGLLASELEQARRL